MSASAEIKLDKSSLPGIERLKRAMSTLEKHSLTHRFAGSNLMRIGFFGVEVEYQGARGVFQATCIDELIFDGREQRITITHHTEVHGHENIKPVELDLAGITQFRYLKSNRFPRMRTTSPVSPPLMAA